MENENSESQTEKGISRKSRKFKIITWVLGVTAGLILLLFFGIPLYLSSSGGTNLLLGKINQSVEGQVQMDDFSMGWFRGVELTNLSYADASGDTSVTVRRIETQPKYTSLLTGKVKLGMTVIDQPQVFLKVPQSESAPKEKKPSAEKKKSTSATAFPIDQMDLKVIDGSATIELVDGVSRKVQFANIASHVQIAEAGKPSSVDLSMDVDGAPVSAKGTLTPAKEGWTIEDSDFKVQVSNLQLANLKPLFALAGQPMDMAGALNADATIQVKDGTIQRLQADATITDFAQGSGEQRTVFEKPVTLSALLVGNGKTVKIENAMVESSFCTIDCSGTLESLDYNVDADLAQMQRFAGQFTDMQGLAVAGQLTARGKVNMTDTRIGVSGAGTARQLIIEKDGMQTPMTDMQADFDGSVDKTANQFQLASANLTATPGTVTVSNLVLPMSAEAAKTVSLDARTKLDLAKTWPFVQVFADLPKDVQMAGMLNSTVKVRTEQSRIQLLTEDTRIDNLRITQPGAEPFTQESVTLTGDIVLDTEAQRIDIRRLNLKAADGESLIKINKGNIEKTTRQDTTNVSGDMEVQYDLRTLSAVASPYLPQGLMLEGNRMDTVRFESQYPANQPELLADNLNANATFGFSKAEFNGLDIGSTEMKLNIVNGLLDFNIPETTVNEGKMQFAGTMDLKETPLFFRLKEPMPILQNIQVNDTLTRNLLLYTNPVFADAVRTSGIASFSCRQMAIPLSKEHLDQMVIDGSFGIESLRLQAGAFLGQLLTVLNIGDTAMLTLHPTNFTVKNGYVSYEEMQLDVGKTPLYFAGKIGLDQSLTMTVDIPISDRSIALPIEGSLARPKINTAKLIELQGRQLIEQELQRQLERIFQ